ncbi:hypothetical protein BJF90_32000 [Pseudonocardia sp. CNS-004]|nr:hypothetical protein BJF90_32000 [Pseudonocardia sp. CNS-004]
MNVSTFVLLAASTLTAHIAWRRGARALAVCAGGFAPLLAWAVIREAHPLVVAALVGIVAAVAWQRWGRSSSIVARWGDRSRRKSGVASGVDIARHRGAVSMRRRAATLRPSLRAATRTGRARQLLRLPAREVAVELCRTGPARVWSPMEEVVLVFGGPRKGKTQWLAGRILDASGAVIATSTRLDLLQQVGAMRAAKGPVYVFNPVGLGMRKSTITFDPLIGCADPVTAMERAADMIGGTGHGLSGSSGDREFWDEQGRRILAALMHAAALGGLSMDTVQDWLAELDASQQEITRLLRDHSTEPGFVAAITQFIGTNDRTRTSITATIAPALGWLTHGPARAAAKPADDGGPSFDVSALLEDHALVFIVGARRPRCRRWCARSPGTSPARPDGWPRSARVGGWTRRCRCGSTSARSSARFPCTSGPLTWVAAGCRSWRASRAARSSSIGGARQRLRRSSTTPAPGCSSAVRRTGMTSRTGRRWPVSATSAS